MAVVGVQDRLVRVAEDLIGVTDDERRAYGAPLPPLDRYLEGQSEDGVEHLTGDDIGEVLEAYEVLPLLDIVYDDGV